MDAKLVLDTIRTMMVISGALAAGYCMRKSGHASDSLAGPVNRIALTYIQPFVIGLSLWAMKRPDLQTLALPLFGIALILLMWPVGAVMSRLCPMDRPSRGTFVTASMFSNVGFTYGTFIAFVAMGPQGAALGALYCVSFMPSLFTLGFFVGRRYSDNGSQSILASLAELARDAQTRNPVLGIIAGLTLNVLSVAPPGEAAFIIDLTMPATTAAFLFAIGLGLRFSSLKTYWRECLLLHGAKFVIAPALGLLLAAAFGYWQLADHSLLRVAFIQSATPTAIMCVMVSDVFNLNRELAGALWLATNITSIFLAPVILVLARML